MLADVTIVLLMRHSIMLLLIFVRHVRFSSNVFFFVRNVFAIIRCMPYAFDLKVNAHILTRGTSLSAISLQRALQNRYLQLKIYVTFGSL